VRRCVLYDAVVPLANSVPEERVEARGGHVLEDVAVPVWRDSHIDRWGKGEKKMRVKKLKIEKVYLFKKRKMEVKRRREGIRARGAWPLYWLYFFLYCDRMGKMKSLCNDSPRARLA
jgi:hypothetical protein